MIVDIIDSSERCRSHSNNYTVYSVGPIPDQSLYI